MEPAFINVGMLLLGVDKTGLDSVERLLDFVAIFVEEDPCNTFFPLDNLSFPA